MGVTHISWSEQDIFRSKDECPVDGLCLCFYLLTVHFKKQRQVSEKITIWILKHVYMYSHNKG